MENTLIIKRLQLAQDYTELLDREGYPHFDMNIMKPFYSEAKENHTYTIIFERYEQLMSIRSDWTRSLLNYNENFHLSHRMFGYFGPVVRGYETFYQAGVELYGPEEAEILKSIDMHLSFFKNKTPDNFRAVVVNNDKLLDLYVEKYSLDISIKDLIYEKNISEIRKNLGEDHPLTILMTAKVSDQIDIINNEFQNSEELDFINHLRHHLAE